MAKVGKTNAGTVPDSAPSIKSRGLKNPTPQKYELEVGTPEMAMDNGDGSKRKAAPKSGKRQPGKMEE